MRPPFLFANTGAVLFGIAFCFLEGDVRMEIIYSCWQIKDACDDLKRAIAVGDDNAVSELKREIQRNILDISEERRCYEREDGVFCQKELDYSKEKQGKRPEMSF